MAKHTRNPKPPSPLIKAVRERLEQTLDTTRWQLQGKGGSLSAVYLPATRNAKKFKVQVFISRTSDNRLFTVFEVAKNEAAKDEREQIASSIRNALSKFPIPDNIQPSRASSIIRLKMQLGSEDDTEDNPGLAAEVEKVVEFIKYIDMSQGNWSVGPDDLLEKAKAFHSHGGESPEHKALKEYVSNNPKVLGLPGEMIGNTEYPLASADRVDILFTSPESKVIVEVKSIKSPERDILRGMFQCIKYAAVLSAETGIPIPGRLVIEGSLTPNLRIWKQQLGTIVHENVSAKTNQSPASLH